MKKNIIGIFCFLLALNSLVCQEIKNHSDSLSIKLPSSVKIIGTSTLHDWESIVEKTDAKLTVNNLNEVNIETLNVNVDVLSIKSGKRIMDKLTYKALQSDEFPVITFIFKKGEIIKEDKSFVEIKLIGDLFIAGVTKNVAVNTKINKLGKTITLTGAHKLKMTDFGISPPTALLGTIKTGDEITIDFNLTFK